MKDGTKIRICNLYDDHLLNIIHRMENISYRLEDIDYVDINDVFPIYKQLIKEKRYRGLK
jgi:hypothetical protein